MSTNFNTPQEVEDAYYDAIDECDLEKMMSLWDPSAESTCLLPMQPTHHGKETITKLWGSMLDPEFGVSITVNHLQWSEHGDIAIHIVEEVVSLTKMGETQPPVYATNIYQRGENGWRMLMHLNSPAPPPTGANPGMPPQGAD
jgi:ketosteroid isomerase-like protein